jgi:hypothetical protein
LMVKNQFHAIQHYIKFSRFAAKTLSYRV